MIIQWKETDLQFIRRLLAEIGIWFRFENHHKVQTETVVIFLLTLTVDTFTAIKKLPYVRYSGMTSYDEYVTDLEEQHSLIPEQVLVRTYNYRDPYSPQAIKTIINNDIPEGITSGESITTPIITSQTAIFHATEAETATFYARLRYERLLNEQSRLSATTSDPALRLGVMFHLTGPVPDGFKPGFFDYHHDDYGQSSPALSRAARRHSVSVRDTTFDRSICRDLSLPVRCPRGWPLSEGDKTYAGVDAGGRYCVKFDF